VSEASTTSEKLARRRDSGRLGAHEGVAVTWQRHGVVLLFGGFLAAAMAGCSAPSQNPGETLETKDTNDPFESVNRDIFDFNLALDRNVVRPVAQAYREVPEPVRDGIHNLLVTLGAPVIFANDLLQGQIDRAGDTLTRLLINLTAGVGGFFDVARTQGGVESHEADFGQTLGVWGVGEGPYLMLPIFGPSNPRDAVARAAGAFMDPLQYVTGFVGEGVARGVTSAVDQRERNLETIDELERTSLDYYATIRSLYRQRRNNLIEHGTSGAAAPALDIPIEEPAADRSSPHESP